MEKENPRVDPRLFGWFFFDWELLEESRRYCLSRVAGTKPIERSKNWYVFPPQLIFSYTTTTWSSFKELRSLVSTELCAEIFVYMKACCSGTYKQNKIFVKTSFEVLLAKKIFIPWDISELFSEKLGSVSQRLTHYQQVIVLEWPSTTDVSKVPRDVNQSLRLNLVV